MARRLLSNAGVIRGFLLLRGSSSNSLVASGSAFQRYMKYSSGTSGDVNSTATRMSADDDTHEDFQPTSKTSSIPLHDIVEQDVKGNPILIYMKGLPSAPMCGFSALAVRVLQQYDVPIAARDILRDQKLKDIVKSYSNWPTFPQIFIKGEFIGGSDIVLSMHQKGELKTLLTDVAEKSSQDGA